MKSLFWPTGTGVSHKQILLLFVVIVVHQGFLVKVCNTNICFHKCLWGLFVCWILYGSKIALNFSKPKNNLKNENTFPMHMVKYLFHPDLQKQTKQWTQIWKKNLLKSRPYFLRPCHQFFKVYHRQCWWITCALSTTPCCCHPSLPIWAESMEGCTSVELNWSATAEPVITQWHPQDTALESSHL